MGKQQFDAYSCVKHCPGTDFAKHFTVETEKRMCSVLPRAAMRFACTILFLISSITHAAWLEWDRSSDTNVIGYRVYFGPTSRGYDSVLDVSNETTVTIPPLAPGTAYYFAVTAYNSSALESDFSEETSYIEPSPNETPFALGDNYQTLQETVLNVPAMNGVLDNDVDPDGDLLSALLVSSAAHGTLSLVADGSFVYSPMTGFTGTDSFTYECTDGNATSAVTTVTITVGSGPPPPANNVPIAQADNYQTSQGTQLRVTAAAGLLNNDSDADGDSLVALLVSTTAHGPLSLNTNGGFVYTPITGFVGTDSFTYRCSDGKSVSATATVTITITSVVTPPPANHSPDAQSDSYTTMQNASLNVPAASGVLSNDFDADNDPLSILLISTTTHGTLNLDTNGAFSYVPTQDFVGTDNFTYAVTDGKATSILATVTLTVVQNGGDSVCPECLVELDQLITSRGGSLSTLLSGITVPENATCLEVELIEFHTLVKRLGRLNDSAINAALATASACLNANLQVELSKRRMRVDTLLPSKWSTLASNRLVTISNQLQQCTELEIASRAKKFMSAAASLRRADRYIASGQLAPSDLSNKTYWFRFSQSGHTLNVRLQILPDGFFVMEKSDGTQMTGACEYERTAFDCGTLQLLYDGASDVITLTLRFGATRGKISGDMRGWFTKL